MSYPYTNNTAYGGFYNPQYQPNASREEYDPTQPFQHPHVQASLASSQPAAPAPIHNPNYATASQAFPGLGYAFQSLSGYNQPDHDVNTAPTAGDGKEQAGIYQGSRGEDMDMEQGEIDSDDPYSPPPPEHVEPPAPSSLRAVAETLGGGELAVPLSVVPAPPVKPVAEPISIPGLESPSTNPVDAPMDGSAVSSDDPWSPAYFAEQKEKFKPFIYLLHQNGIPFQTLLEEGLHEGLLRQLFLELRLSTTSTPVPVSKVDKTVSQPATQSKSRPDQNRNEYLAKLEALKKKTINSAPKPAIDALTGGVSIKTTDAQPDTAADERQARLAHLRKVREEALKSAKKAQERRAQAGKEQLPDQEPTNLLDSNASKRATSPVTFERSNQRKRPVAADFDSAIQPAAKRSVPSSNQSSDECIIEASDEDMDSDDESQAGQSMQQVQPSTPGSEYLSHQQKIADMRRKIEELEKKKHARSEASRAATPLNMQSLRSATQPTPSASGPLPSAKLGSPGGISLASPLPSASRSETPMPPNMSPAEWRKQRMAQMRANMQRRIAEKQQIIRELKELGFDLDGLQEMSVEDLIATRDELKAELEEEAAAGVEALAPQDAVNEAVATRVMENDEERTLKPISHETDTRLSESDQHSSSQSVAQRGTPSSEDADMESGTDDDDDPMDLGDSDSDSDSESDGDQESSDADMGEQTEDDRPQHTQGSSAKAASDDTLATALRDEITVIQADGPSLNGTALEADAQDPAPPAPAEAANGSPHDSPERVGETSPGQAESDADGGQIATTTKTGVLLAEHNDTSEHITAADASADHVQQDANQVQDTFAVVPAESGPDTQDKASEPSTESLAPAEAAPRVSAEPGRGLPADDEDKELAAEQSMDESMDEDDEDNGASQDDAEDSEGGQDQDQDEVQADDDDDDDEDQEDDYEPPEINGELEESTQATATADGGPPSMSDGPRAENEENKEDDEEEEDEDEEDDDDDDEDEDAYEPPAAVETADSAHEVEDAHVEEDDATAGSAESDSEGGFASDMFKPYESALRSFKTLRNSADVEVKGPDESGAESQGQAIDPNRELCPFEAAGGTCNDPQCPLQHFDDMVALHT